MVPPWPRNLSRPYIPSIFLHSIEIVISKTFSVSRQLPGEGAKAGAGVSAGAGAGIGVIF